MISVYKYLYAIYWIVGALCVAGGAYMVLLNKEKVFLYWILFLGIMVLTAYILTIVAIKKFNNEVISLLLNCHANDYMEMLEKKLGKNRRKNMKSAYNYLKAMGYSSLGDYDALYECTQQITSRSHKSEYLRRLCEYYINTDRFIEARDLLDQLNVLTSSIRKKTYRESLETSIKMMDYSIKVKNGDYEGVEEYYKGLLEHSTPSTVSLLSKVSISFALGNLLVIKGENEHAKEHLRFAFENGGDTKYVKAADSLLSKIS